MLALEENPPVIPSFAQSLTQLQGQWWVAHTKSRFEKAFAWDLHARNIGYFLPMQARTIFSGGRERKGMAPLFPSYVFFCGDENVRWQALRTNRLCQVIPVPQQEMLLAELLQIHRVILSGQRMEAYPTPPVGARCRVIRGPFEGTTGIVVEQGKSARLVLTVSVLGRGSVLDIDAELLEPCEEEAMDVKPAVQDAQPANWQTNQTDARIPAW